MNCAVSASSDEVDERTIARAISYLRPRTWALLVLASEQACFSLYKPHQQESACRLPLSPCPKTPFCLSQTEPSPSGSPSETPSWTRLGRPPTCLRRPTLSLLEEDSQESSRHIISSRRLLLDCHPASFSWRHRTSATARRRGTVRSLNTSFDSTT
jgi:hypothetical protein